MEYQVRIPRGSGRPSCSCPDARNHAGRLAGGYCKHIIGCLMRSGEAGDPDDDLTFHLMDVLL